MMVRGFPSLFFFLRGFAGGFADNFIFDDTWYFNITSSRWLQKKE
jgi:hypothetical protein